MASEQVVSPQSVLAKRQEALIGNLSGIQHQTMSLKRAKYRVVRRVAKWVTLHFHYASYGVPRHSILHAIGRRSLKWDVHEKDDKDATIVWLDRWEHADLTNLRTFKVGLASFVVREAVFV